MDAKTRGNISKIRDINNSRDAIAGTQKRLTGRTAVHKQTAQSDLMFQLSDSRQLTTGTSGNANRNGIASGNNINRTDLNQRM
jgi:hypothetical protein